MLARKTIALASIFIFCTSANAQTPFLKVAAFFSSERKDNVLATMSKDDVAKDFSPYLKDPQDSASFVIAAFALAMKGVDVDANIGRLVMPIKDSHDGKIDELEANRGLAQNQILLEDIPNSIYLIYKTRHYTPALKTLLTMPVDWPAAEYRDDCIMSQLRIAPDPVIALASQDKKIYSTLSDIIDWNVGAMPDRKAFVHRMETAHWPPTLKATAIKLAHDVATPKNRPAK